MSLLAWLMLAAAVCCIAYVVVLGSQIGVTR